MQKTNYLSIKHHLDRHWKVIYSFESQVIIFYVSIQSEISGWITNSFKMITSTAFPQVNEFIWKWSYENQVCKLFPMSTAVIQWIKATVKVHFSVSVIKLADELLIFGEAH